MRPDWNNWAWQLFPMKSSLVNSLAREMFALYKSAGTTLPLSAREEGIDLPTACAVEAEFRRLREEEGRIVAGRKAGYANKAIWRALKLETLVWAHMYDDTVHFSVNGRSVFDLSAGQPLDARIEPEIVFKLKHAPDAGLDAAGVLLAVEWLAVGFEIIACPFPGWQFQPADFVAAWGLHRGLIVGPPRAVNTDDIPALTEQLRNFKLRLLKNGQVAAEGAGRNSLLSPALCLAEFAGAVQRQTGCEPIKAGELFSSGTLTSAQPISPRDEWSVELEGLDIPNLTLSLH